MSTIKITFGTQPLDGGQDTPGMVQFTLNANGTQYVIRETLVTTVPSYYQFAHFPWNGDQTASDNNQTINFQSAFRRDHLNTGNIPTGGLQVSNLSTSINGNQITITARNGTFSDFSYSGDYLVISHTITNTVQEDPKTFSYTQTDTGSCSQIQYTAQAATGGTGNYRLNLLGADIFTGWDGNVDINFNLDRGIAYSGNLYDDSGTVIKSVSIIPPRKIKEGDFKVDLNYNSGFADVTVRTVTEVSGTTPLEFALVDPDSNQTAWQTSTIFAGQLPGLFTLKVRDKYGCEISKVFEIYDLTDPNNDQEQIRYFKISDFNSLSFAENVDFGFDVRPNYENTLSNEEAVGLPYQDIYWFPSKSNIKTQFKSSYQIHVCTLLKSDGTKQALPVKMTQENIGTVERVDCKVFPIIENGINTGTGVYFEGGNSYLPNSSTLATDPTSPYNGGIPSWAEIGNYISLATYGTHQITDTDLYDSSRGVLYFKIDFQIASEATDIVQVTYNRHPYNVFRCDFPMSYVTDSARVVIEAGWSIDGVEQIERRFDSEIISVLKSPKDFLKITWTSEVNFDDMVFSDGIDCEMWVKGRIRHFSVNSSDVADSDDRVRSLKQRHRMGQRATIPLMSAKKWHKLGLAAGIGDDGEFRIENMLLVATNNVQEEELGDTNFFNITAEFAYGGENLSIKADEIILNPTTGIVGSGLTGKEPVNDPVLRLLRLDSGKFLQTTTGKYISLDV